MEQRRIIMAVTQMLDSGTLDERSSRLLEQLASCIRCLPAEAALRPEPEPEVTQQSAPLREAPTEAKSSKEPGVEPDLDGLFREPAEKRIVVGSLRTTPEDKWTCKVPSCTGSFHRLEDCRFFHSMEPEDRVKLVEHHDLCLTPGHGQTARSCPYMEESGRMHAKDQRVRADTTTFCTWISARPRGVRERDPRHNRPACSGIQHQRRILDARYSWSPSGSPPKGAYHPWCSGIRAPR